MFASGRMNTCIVMVSLFVLLSLVFSVPGGGVLVVVVDSFTIHSSPTASISQKLYRRSGRSRSWKSPSSSSASPSSSSATHTIYHWRNNAISNTNRRISIAPFYGTTTPKENNEHEIESSIISSSDASDVSRSSNTSSITPSNGKMTKEKIDPNTDGTGPLPSYRTLLVFTATTVLIWLSEPLLSLVDTTIVGMTAPVSSAVVQIAALGPATTLFDSLIYTTYFLAMATTNQLAPELATANAAEAETEAETETAVLNTKKKKTNPWNQLRRSTSHLMGLSLLLGCIVAALTFGIGKPVIGQMVGGATHLKASEATMIVRLADNYARIRATVAPFSVVGFVAQAFCLTTLDVATPAIAVAAASIVNVIGDLILSPAYGIQGAAVATAMATVASCLILVRKVQKTTTEWKNKAEKYDRIYQSVPATTASSDTEDVPFWSLPDKKSTIDLVKVAAPIFFVMIAKVACYNVMTIRAANFGMVALASHNIMMRVFNFFGCFGDSLSQAAQSFYPQVSKNLRRELVKRLIYIACLVGLFNISMSRLVLNNFGRFISKDANIIGLMAKHWHWVGYSTLLQAFIQVFEGTLLAKRDLVYMGGAYLVTTLLHFGVVFSPYSSTFMGLWRTLLTFQSMRFAQFTIRVWMKSWEKKRKNNSNDSIIEQLEGMPAAPPL